MGIQLYNTKTVSVNGEEVIIEKVWTKMSTTKFKRSVTPIEGWTIMYLTDTDIPQEEARKLYESN